VTPAHRAPARMSRRGLLGIAGLAAVPAVTFAGLQARAKETAAAATPRLARAGAAPGATGAGPGAVTKGGGPVAFRRGTAMLGSYLDLSGKSLRQSLDLRRHQLGRDERIVHVFYAWTDTLPSAIPALPDKAVPMVSWRGTGYADIVSGASDRMIARAARRLKDLGRATMLRWGWEMNGDWYAWCGSRNGNRPDGYVRSWQRLHRIFADEGADNVSWVWSPNWNSSPDADWNQPACYYPGDEYVDWVGMSGYNLHRETPATMFDAIYTAYSARKPIAITEVGSVDRGGRTKADWITLFADWVRERPGVGAVTWFDTDTHPGYAERWRIDTDAESLAAYRAMAASPRFSG
jgi:hypothetical protein